MRNFLRGIAFLHLSLMRTPFRLILIALILTGMACPAPAQEAGKIVEQYVKAVGGSKALSRIQTLTLEGTFTSGDGKAGTYTLDTSCQIATTWNCS